jgi:glucuronate isomerase
VIPTFRPDDLINPAVPVRRAMRRLGEMTGTDIGRFDGFLDAIRDRRAAFRARGATATDHDVPDLRTEWLPRAEIEALHDKALKGALRRGGRAIPRSHAHRNGADVRRRRHGHADPCRLHALHQSRLADRFGPDMGADIPRAMNWVDGLDALLNRVGNDPRFSLIVFTLDEASYARELAPMAGHWPALRLGPPWWFHDSLNGIRRYFDAVVETAGYRNLAGFNDDTRAFLSIPARHDLWRRGVALHLAEQVEGGVLRRREAERVAAALAVDLARDAYRLPGA